MMQDLQTFREHRDAAFGQSEQSPLTPAQRASFAGLTYFEPNPLLDLVVTVERFEKPENIEMQTNTGATRWFVRYGRFSFEVEGETVELTLYLMPPHAYFLPFVDSLAGQETYGAGRYIDVEPLGGDQFAVDFNKAYNPLCAYNDGWVCPIPPAENRLAVPIRAGEKLPQGAWLQAK